MNLISPSNVEMAGDIRSHSHRIERLKMSDSFKESTAYGLVFYLKLNSGALILEI